MKRTLTVNLNSIVFHIEDDAYEVLSKYLSDIASHFSSEEEKTDIMADIEARIAELFSERLQRNKEVISMHDVREIIAVMGNPSQFSDGNETTGQEAETAFSATETKKQKGQKRFYRDPENKILGGICSGLATYFNIDVTLVRILLVILTFISTGFPIVVYLVVWLIAPEAVTASQRLEMQGEDVTIENIKAEFENVKNYVESEKFKSDTKTFGQRLVEFFGWIVKAGVIFVGAILAFPLVIVLFVLFVVLISLLLGLTGLIPAFMFGSTIIPPEENSVLLIISLLFVVGAPVFMLIYGLTRSRSKNKSHSRTTYLIAIILWIAGIFMFVGTVANSSNNWWSNHSNWNVTVNGVNWSNRNARAVNDGVFIDKIVEISEFRYLDVSGLFEIEIINSPYQQLVLSACENFMPEITAEVRGETLVIFYFNHLQTTPRLRNPVRISLSTDVLERITARGMADIRNDSIIKIENLHLDLIGASRVNLNVEVENEIRIESSGASRINLSGKSESIRLNASGASQINTENLKAEHVNVNVSGASSARIYASESLNLNASGASRIIIFGSPAQVNQRSSGGSSVSMR